MSLNQGALIVAQLRQIRRLFEDVSLLLQTCDPIMAGAGWRPLDNTACAQGSRAVGSPSQWLIREAFRFYVQGAANARHRIAWIAVILDDIDAPERVPAPIITGGWVYSHGGYGAGGCATGYCRWLTWMPGFKSDGSLWSQRPADDWKGQEAPRDVQFVAAFGHPLIEITNAEVLKTKIVGPLLNHLGQQHSGETA